jgi:hypothetical protein
MSTGLIKPKPGWEHFGCPECGYIVCLPCDPGEDPPWCVHNDNYAWRAPHPQTQAGPHAWTQMVKVEVRQQR